ncbi:MAG: hypothetical protein M1838_002496 [Thelocarpon superellum]|nr:MAG: hypothetical protein M1838_002496 [Thelocarpon superellum]
MNTPAIRKLEASILAEIDEDIQALSPEPPRVERYLKLSRQMKKASPNWPVSRQPWPTVRLELSTAHVVAHQWIQGLARLLEVYFYTDPLLYPLPWHPMRVIHKWALARLMIFVAQASEAEPEEVKGLEKYRLEYGLVVWALLKEVEENVDKSHGTNTLFALQVKRKLEQVKVDMESSQEYRTRQLLSPEAMEVEWAKLRRIASEISDEWTLS